MKKNILKSLSVVALLGILTASTSFAKEALKIGIADDAVNGARAIKLLEKAGLIEVDPAAGFSPELKDVTKYNYNIELVPTTTNTLVSTLDDFVASTINSTFSVPAGLVPSRDALLIEKQSLTGTNPFINVIVAREADKDNPVYAEIVRAFQTQEVARYILTKFNEARFPAFEYDPNFTKDQAFVDAIDAHESSREGKKIVRVGVCGSMHGQWAATQKVLDDRNAGIHIELVEFSAYSLPNEALNAGDIELNAFQHTAFLNNEIKANGYKIVPIGDTVIAPLALFSKKVKSIEELKELAGKLE